MRDKANAFTRGPSTYGSIWIVSQDGGTPKSIQMIHVHSILMVFLNSKQSVFRGTFLLGPPSTDPSCPRAALRLGHLYKQCLPAASKFHSAPKIL